MDWLQFIVGVVAGSGGLVGVTKFLRLFKPVEAPTVREFRNAHLLELRADIAKFGEYLIDHSRALARIEGTLKDTAHRLDNRIDEHQERISDLEDFRRRIEARERPT